MARVMLNMSSHAIYVTRMEYDIGLDIGLDMAFLWSTRSSHAAGDGSVKPS